MWMHPHFEPLSLKTSQWVFMTCWGAEGPASSLEKEESTPTSLEDLLVVALWCWGAVIAGKGRNHTNESWRLVGDAKGAGVAGKGRKHTNKSWRLIGGADLEEPVSSLRREENTSTSREDSLVVLGPALLVGSEVVVLRGHCCWKGKKPHQQVVKTCWWCWGGWHCWEGKKAHQWVLKTHWLCWGGQHCCWKGKKSHQQVLKTCWCCWGANVIASDRQGFQNLHGLGKGQWG